MCPACVNTLSTLKLNLKKKLHSGTADYFSVHNEMVIPAWLGWHKETWNVINPFPTEVSYLQHIQGNTPEIYFTYLDKDISYIYKTCCTISVLFPTHLPLISLLYLLQFIWYSHFHMACTKGYVPAHCLRLTGNITWR